LTIKRELFIRMALVGGGIGFALILLLSGFIVVFGDARLLMAYAYDDVIVYRAGMGDILYWQGEFVAPIENPDEILSVHRLRLDERGFRMPAQVAEDYEVVALGDSFTEGANVGMPWPDVFAQASGLTTRNLGFRGYGPVQYAYTMETFGVNEHPEVVIVGFFGGNDLATSGLDLPNPALPAEERLLDQPLNLDLRRNAEAGASYRYPAYLENGEPIAFLSTYISWMNLTEETLVQSVNYEVIGESLSRIHAAAPNACLIFAYLPSKAEVYLPYVQAEYYPQIIEGQQHVLIDSDGTLLILDDPNISIEKLLVNRQSTPHALAGLAQEAGFAFINLWDGFDEAAANGESLYYTYDTHWNQAGQTLAGELLAEFVQANC
jgi:hypothetical protein